MRFGTAGAHNGGVLRRGWVCMAGCTPDNPSSHQRMAPSPSRGGGGDKKKIDASPVRGLTGCESGLVCLRRHLCAVKSSSVHFKEAFGLDNVQRTQGFSLGRPPEVTGSSEGTARNVSKNRNYPSRSRGSTNASSIRISASGKAALALASEFGCKSVSHEVLLVSLTCHLVQDLALHPRSCSSKRLCSSLVQAVVLGPGRDHRQHDGQDQDSQAAAIKSSTSSSDGP